MHKIRNATKNAKLQDVVRRIQFIVFALLINVKYLLQIEMYSLQMYHNRLQFYICGLFPLDFTLLHTVRIGF